MPLPPHISQVRRYQAHPRLGRHLVLDRRSLAHRVAEADPASLRVAEWQPRIPVLNQADLTAQGIDVTELLPGAPPANTLGSCTGNASCYALSAVRDTAELTAIGLSTTDAAQAQKVAITWYAAATTMDEWSHLQYPADDCGSSGLGTSKAGLKAGWIAGYQTATSALALASALQTGPVIIGMPWHESFFETDARGFIDRGDWRNSAVAGGHEVCGAVLETVQLTPTGDLDLDATTLACPNSWGPSWGDNGWLRMRLSTYAVLRAEIDVYQFRVTGQEAGSDG